MERIAIISDIHGNLEALKSVFKDIEKRNINKIICLGDIIAKGVNQSECLSLIKDKCEIIIQGNCDDYFSINYDTSSLSGIQRKRIVWNQALVSDDERAFLLKLPFSHEFYMSGSLIRLFHSTPYSHSAFVSNLNSFDKKLSLFYPTENTTSNSIADVIIYGHLHIQYLEKIYNRTLINAGSVGNPIDIIRNGEKDGKNIETTRANYLIIEGEYGSEKYSESLSFQFIRVPYDIDKELRSDKVNIERKQYEIELKQGKYRDEDKIDKRLEQLGINKQNI